METIGWMILYLMFFHPVGFFTTFGWIFAFIYLCKHDRDNERLDESLFNGQPNRLGRQEWF